MAESGNLRTLGELRTLYDIRPTIRDVVVEGRKDRDLYRWYLRQRGARDIEVYAVDDRVEVPANVVFAAAGDVGARGRILGLARASAEWTLSQDSLTCVIDADRDCLAPGPEFPHLLRTDMGSSDVYLLQEGPVGRFLELTLGRTELASELVEELIPPLVEVFLIRAALHDVAVRLVDSFTACCAFGASGAQVDGEELVRRSLARASRGEDQGRVMARLEALRALLPVDSLRAIRGHDIAPVIVRRLRLRNDWAKIEVVEAALRGCITPEDLDGFPLFRALCDRLDLK